jgi:hypothetical protein
VQAGGIVPRRKIVKQEYLDWDKAIDVLVDDYGYEDVDAVAIADFAKDFGFCEVGTVLPPDTVRVEFEEGYDWFSVERRERP